MSFAGPSIPGRWLLTIALVLLPAWHALAEPEDPMDGPRGAARWLPALGIASVLNLQSIEGLAESPQRARADDEHLKVFAGMEGHLELASPVLFSGFGSPRLFVRGGAGRQWDSVHLTAEGKPGQPRVNLLPNGNQPPVPGVSGQGTGVRTEFSPYFYTASAGLVFTLPFAERDLRLKPSIEYRRGAVEIEALVSDAVSIAGDPNCPCLLGLLGRKDQQDHDMLGAGLELEVDTQRAGSVMLSLFISTQAYRVLTGRKLKVAASGFYDDGTTPLDLRARTFLDEWSFRAGVGLRLRWLPE